MKARVIVTLKTGVLDPQGKAIEGALRSLGIEGVRSVRQGKVFEIEVDGEPAAAEKALRAASEKLLANTVIENFRVELDAPPAPAPQPEAAEPTSAPEEPGPTDPAAIDPDKATEIAARAAEMPREGHP